MSLIQSISWKHLCFQLILFLTVGCSADIKRSFQLQVNSREIDIPISHKLLSTYHHSDNFYKDGNDYFIGYNHTTHSFDIFDFTNENVLESIKLESEGPNGIASLGTFAANKDYIVAIHQNAVMYVFNHSGQVVNTLRVDDILELQGLSLAPMEIVFGNFSKISLSGDNVISLPVFKAAKRLSDEYYQNFYLMEIVLSKGKIDYSLMKLNYPDAFKENFYGDFDKPYVLNKESSIFYNFPMSSTLYKLDEESGENVTFSLFKDRISKTIPQLNKQAYDDFVGARFDYFFNSARYFYPVFDSYRKLYYLVRKEETEDEKDRYEKNFLMIFDLNFNFVKEIKLNNSLTPVYGVTEEGVYFLFNSRNIKNESYLSFYLMEIEVN